MANNLVTQAETTITIGATGTTNTTYCVRIHAIQDFITVEGAVITAVLDNIRTRLQMDSVLTVRLDLTHRISLARVHCALPVTTSLTLDIVITTHTTVILDPTLLLEVRRARLAHQGNMLVITTRHHA